MNISIREGLPFVTVRIEHEGQEVEFKNAVLAPGSAGSLFGADGLAAIGLAFAPDDQIHRIRGVGGAEFVFTK